MKKINILYVIGIILIVLCIYSLINDYLKYYPYGSAPFYLYIIERTIEFGLPAIVCFVAGNILKKKNKQNS